MNLLSSRLMLRQCDAVKQLRRIDMFEIQLASVVNGYSEPKNF